MNHQYSTQMSTHLALCVCRSWRRTKTGGLPSPSNRSEHFLLHSLSPVLVSTVEVVVFFSCELVHHSVICSYGLIMTSNCTVQSLNTFLYCVNPGVLTAVNARWSLFNPIDYHAYPLTPPGTAASRSVLHTSSYPTGKRSQNVRIVLNGDEQLRWPHRSHVWWNLGVTVV